LSFLSSGPHEIALILTRRGEEYRIPLHSPNHQLKQQVKELKQQVNQFEQQAKELQDEMKKMREEMKKMREGMKGENASAVLSLATNQQIQGNEYAWNIQNMPIMHPFSLSEDKKQVKVNEAGIYFIYCRLLNKSGSVLNPCLKLNGTIFLYAYGGGAAYNDANCLIPVKLKVGDIISVSALSSGTAIYTHKTAEYCHSNLVIWKMV